MMSNDVDISIFSLSFQYIPIPMLMNRKMTNIVEIVY